MKLLNENERYILLSMLLDDKSYKLIRSTLSLPIKANIEDICNYNGGKLAKAYKLHKNNDKKINKDNINSKSLTVLAEQPKILTEEVFKNSMGAIMELIGNNQNLLEDKINTKRNSFDDIIDINEMPNFLPGEIDGSNYIVISKPSKLVEGVSKDFDIFCKAVKKEKKFNKIQLMSWALLEFMKKYPVENK